MSFETTPEPAKAEQGDFSRGLSVSGKQLKQTAYGTAALIGDTVGATKLRDWGLKGYQDAEEEVKSIQKESDSFTSALETGSLGKWLTYSSGYLIGQVAELGAASIAGGLIGTAAAPGAGTAAGALTGAVEKGAVQSGIRAFVGKMIDKQAAEAAAKMVEKGVAKDVAEKMAAEQAAKSVYRTIGATTANTFLNATQELGSIYGDAVEEAAKTGKEYSLGKIWLAGIAATAVDSWSDSKAVGKFLGSFGGNKAMSGIAMEALKGGFREGMTEGIQTAIERWGADKDLTSKEAFKDYIDSAAVGFLGGSVSGGASGAINKFTKPADTTTPPANTVGETKESASVEPADKSAPSLEGLPRMQKDDFLETLGNMDAMAYLYSVSNAKEQQDIEKSMQRANLIEEFDDARGKREAIDAGKTLLEGNTAFESMLRAELDTFANTQPSSTKFKIAKPQQITEEETMRRGQEADEALNKDLSPARGVSVSKNNTAAAPTEDAGPLSWAEAQAQFDKRRVAERTPLTEVGPEGRQPYESPAEAAAYREEQRLEAEREAKSIAENDKELAELDRINAENDRLVAAYDEALSNGPADNPEDAAAYRAEQERMRKEEAEYRAGRDRAALLEAHFSDEFAKIRGKRSKTAESRAENLREQMRKQGIPEADIERIARGEVATAKAEAKEAAANLFDVLSDVTGAKLNITGQKYTVSDLPPAIAKVMQALVKLGYVKFKDISRELMQRIRASKDWSHLADKVSPDMLRQAYSKLSSFEGKESPEDVAKYKAADLGVGQSAEAESLKAKEKAELLSDVATTPVAEGKRGQVRPSYRQGNRLYQNKSGETITATDQRPINARSFMDSEPNSEQEPEIDYGSYKKKEKAPPKPRLEIFTPTLNRLLGDLTKIQKNKVLRTLHGVSKEWLDALDSPGVSEYLAGLDDVQLMDAFEGIADKSPAWLVKFGQSMTNMNTPEAKKLLAYKTAVRNIMNLVNLNAPEATLTTTDRGEVTAAPGVGEEISVAVAADQARMLRQTLAKMQRAVDDIDALLRSSRTITDKQGNRFEGIDQSDENAYLWGEQGFRNAKDLPQDRLLAMRRSLMDDIREMQTKTTQGVAKLFKNAVKNADYLLSTTRAVALRDGVPNVVVDQIYNEAREGIVGLMNDKNVRAKIEIPSLQELLQKTIDEAPLAATDVINEIADGIKSKSIPSDELFRVASSAIRTGRVSYGQLVQALRDRGIDIPQDMLSAAPLLAFQTRMMDYVQQHGNHPSYRMAWLTSMDELVKRHPTLLKLNVFPEAEKIAYEMWKERLTTLKNRRETDFVMENSKNAEDAFRDLLFVKYSLSQMRGETPIEAREAESLRGTIGDLAEAWMQDVDFALRKRPELASQLLDPEEGMIAPTDVEQFRRWQEKNERIKDREADAVSRQPYFDALSSLDGAFPEKYMEEKRKVVYQRFLRMVAKSNLNELDQILANAHDLYAKLATDVSPKSGALIDQMISDYLDVKVAEDEMINGQTIEQFYGMAGDRGNETALSDESLDTIVQENDQYDIESGASLGLDSYNEVHPENEPRLRRGFFTGVMTAAQVQASVAKITSMWKSSPQIVVLQNPTMLPSGIRERVMEKLGGEVSAKGVYDAETGVTYLFSDMLNGDTDTQFTLFHEVYGHMGLRAFLGAKFDSFLENMYRVYPGVRTAADAMIEGGMPKLEAIEEVLADLAGTNPEIGAVKQFVGKVLAGLREIGFGRVADWLGTITNAELSFYLAGARQAAQGGAYRFNGAPGVVRLKEVMHDRLYEMFSLSGQNTKAYARFNPITQTWALFRAVGDDIRGGYNATVHTEYSEVLDAMRKLGKVEFRKRSGVFIDDKLPGDMPRLTEVTNVTGVKLWMRNQITKYQNEYKPIFDLVDRIREMGRLTDRMDVKTALMLYERKTGYIVDYFRRHYVNPLSKLVEEAGKQGADYATINEFLLARHAKERNKQIAKINPKYPDKGSGMATREAEALLKKMAQQPYFEALQEIGHLTDEISKYKLDYQYKTGMITKKAYDAMSVYKHYVNLSGQREGLDMFEDVSSLVGTKFNVKGVERRAMGRATVASDILANTVLAMESAIIRGQKNQVAQKMLALLEANYDPNFAVINEIRYKQKIGEDGMVADVEDPDYIKNKDVMVAKVNGIPVTIRFKDTTAGSVADAIHGMVYPPQSGAWMERLGKFNQFVGQMLTTYNPVWVGVNFVRDTQTLFFNAAADGRITKSQAFEMVRMLPRAIKTAYYMAMVDSGRETSVNPDKEMVLAYREMQRSGGMTSFLDRKGLEQQVGEIEKMLGARTKLQSIGDRFNTFLNALEALTIPMEIAPRLAAYKVTREGGMTKDQAAVFAGEITVNFNMRGSSKEMRQLFLFFNPAVQGTAKLVDVARNNPGRMAAYAAAWAGVGMLANLVGRAFSDDDEDGRNGLDKVPTYKRATSMVLAADVPGAAIPIAYGWNAFYSIGHFMMDSALGVQPVTVSAKRALQASFEAFSPIGSAGLDSKTLVGTAVKTMAPTAALPVVEWMLNENRFGAPIRKTDDPFGGPKLPDSQMAFRSVSPISKGMTDALNTVTGGNRLRSGAIDVNPAAIDFLISSYLPGFVAESYKAASVATRVARGEEVKNTPMPLVDRFTAKIPEGYDAGAFRRAKELVETRYAEFKAFPEKREEIIKELPGLGQAHAIVAGATQEIRKVRKNLTDAENSGRFSDAELVERQNMTREREKMIYQRAVKAVMNAGPEFKNAVMASE